MEPEAPQPPPPPPANPYSAPPPGDPQAPGPAGGGGGNIPWEDRSRLGFMPALIDTVKMVITEPSAAFQRLRANEDYVSPIFFGVILYWVGTLITQMWNLLFGGAMTSMMPHEEGMQFLAMFAGSSVLQIIMGLVLAPFIYVIGLFIGAGIFHLFLMMVGALNSSQNGFEGTLKVMAYSSVTGVANVIPLVGPFVGAIWSLVLLILGFIPVHRTTTGKSVAAVLLPVALCCVCIVAVAVIFGAALASAFSQGGG